MNFQDLEQATPITAPDGTLVREWVSPRNSEATQMSMAEITVPPGVKVAPHYHLRCEENYFIIEGTGLMELGSEKKTIRAGQAVVILPKQRHTLSNTSDAPLKMWVTCVPAWTPEDQVFVD